MSRIDLSEARPFASRANAARAEDLRKEAAALERLADILSYRADKERLAAKVAECLDRAAALEERLKRAGVAAAREPQP